MTFADYGNAGPGRVERASEAREKETRVAQAARAQGEFQGGMTFLGGFIY